MGYDVASLGILIPSFPGKIVSSSTRAEMFKKRKFRPLKMKVRRFGTLVDSMMLRPVPEEENRQIGGVFSL